MVNFSIVVNGNDFDGVYENDAENHAVELNVDATNSQSENDVYQQLVDAIDKADNYAKINKLLHELTDMQKGIEYKF